MNGKKKKKKKKGKKKAPACVWKREGVAAVMLQQSVRKKPPPQLALVGERGWWYRCDGNHCQSSRTTPGPLTNMSLGRREGLAMWQQGGVYLQGVIVSRSDMNKKKKKKKKEKRKKEIEKGKKKGNMLGRCHHGVQGCWQRGRRALCTVGPLLLVVRVVRTKKKKVPGPKTLWTMVKCTRVSTTKLNLSSSTSVTCVM